MLQDDSSKTVMHSEMAAIFARRVSGTDDPWRAMTDLATKLHATQSRMCRSNRLENYLPKRRVLDVVYRPDLECDGFTQPLGLRFTDGFRVALNPSLSPARLRFTFAHEICHTFFYEHVPELKFIPHVCDQIEERLCNAGAAELLMPKKSVSKNAKGLPVTIQALESLAAAFAVSKEAMLIRLRTLGLWNARLSSWTKNVLGEFICEQLDGEMQWAWPDNELAKTWETGEAASGKTFVEYIDINGSRRVRPICYDMQRRHRNILVLWGTWAFGHPAEKLPLFSQKDHISEKKPQKC